MEPREALGFGALLLALGVGYLATTVGWLPAALTALSAAAYLLAYTPLKFALVPRDDRGRVPRARSRR
jgi:heme O synthase-like polyprenyltransferase